MRNQACVLSIVVNDKINKKFFFKSNEDLKNEALKMVNDTNNGMAEVIREAINRYFKKLKEENVTEFRFIHDGIEVVISSCSCMVFKQ